MKKILSFSILFTLIFSYAVQAYTDISAENLSELYMNNCRREISDGDFFGDFKNGSWSKEPMINYSYSPKLNEVEAAAKAGDYETAGAELLNYFQSRYTDPAKKPRGGKSLRVELWIDKIFGFDQQLSLINVFDFSDKPSDCYVNINDSTILKPQLMTFMLMGRHKNGVVSFAASRETDTPPVLEIHYNDGTTVSLVPNADTYTRAGKYANKNYAQAESLEICNSGLKSGKPFDDETRRGFISFDLSKVDTKNIKSARLRLKAWAERVNQQVILFWVKPTVIDEDKMSWDNDLGYIYSWQDLPGGVDWNRPRGAHNQFSNWLLRLYWFHNMTAWAVNDDNPQTGRITLDLIRDFVQDYRANRFDNELNVSARMNYYSSLLPYLFKIEACTPEDCIELLKAVVRDATSLYINESRLSGGNYGNQGMSKFSSLIAGAITFPELADSKLWLDEAGSRLEQNLTSVVLDDGAYIEHTYGYPYGVLDQMISLLELYKTNDLKPPAEFSAKTHQLARYLMFCSMPDGTPPNWGEGTAKNSVTAPVIKRAGLFFNDSELMWWVSRGKAGHTPKVTNVSYPDARIAVLRDSWQPDANVLFFSPRVGGGHYHMDQNSVVLYAYGQKLLNDTGMSSYDSQHPHFDWQRHQTRSHNTVEVEERGYPRLKRTDAYEEGPCGSSVCISDHAGLLEGWAGGYPNIRHERKIFLVKEAGLYIVADMLEPDDDNSRIYDQCWHIYPLNTYETDQLTCKVWTTNSKAANLEIIPVYPEKLELLLRKGFNAVPLMDTTYPSFRQKTAGKAEFITILNPRRAGEPAMNLNTRLVDAGKGARAVKIDSAQGPGIFIVSYGDDIVKADAVETDARCAYVQFGKDGKVRWAVRSGGSMVKFKGKKLDCEEMKKLSPPELPLAEGQNKN
jgi:hypothetical protein